MRGAGERDRTTPKSAPPAALSPRRTAIWTSFSLLKQGFQACQCTPSTCKACFADASGKRKRKHSVRWEQTGTAKKSAALTRQAIPPQLSQQLGHALCSFIPTLASWQQPATTAASLRARGVAAGVA